MSDLGVLLQQVVNGLSLGAMYALLALGFTLVYGILELINFAHFNVFMVSSFFGMWALEFLGITGQSHVLAGPALGRGIGFRVRRDDARRWHPWRCDRASVAAAAARGPRDCGDDHDDRRFVYPV